MDLIWQSAQQSAAALFAAAPRVVIGMLVLVAGIIVGRGVRALVRRAAARRHEHANLSLALGRLTMAGVILLAMLIAVTIAFPGFTPSDLVGALGIGSVALGFAFRDIFQNFLAGILILVTKPFRVGDQIVFGPYEGDVEDIQTRATFLRTYDGRRVIIPNGELYTNAVTVNTAFARRRMEYDIGIGYDDDLEQARRIILDVLESAEGVSPDPKADVIVVSLGESSVNLRARWWSESRIADVLVAQDKVLTEAKARLHEVGIEVPYPTRQILFHDRTAAGGGEASRQQQSTDERH